MVKRNGFLTCYNLILISLFNTDKVFVWTDPKSKWPVLTPMLPPERKKSSRSTLAANEDGQINLLITKSQWQRMIDVFKIREPMIKLSENERIDGMKKKRSN